MKSVDFWTASLYDHLSDVCWNLYRQLKDDFVGYERLCDLLKDASFDFSERFNKLFEDGSPS